jgi:hypothetical protein
MVHKHASLPIIFGGVGFISTFTFAPIAKDWALVVSIIVVRFMINQCPLLLEVLARINNNTFPFQ